ncbi:MAG TPA: response regulator, partial [Polyangiaceae bacterium]
MESAKKIVAEGGGLGGARADFVASLGKRVADARTALAALETDPASAQARDDLRRKLHALGAGSKLLRFDAMASALTDAEATLERVVTQKKASSADLAMLAQLVDDLPALAWSDPKRREKKKTETPAIDVAPIPLTALLVTNEETEDVLTSDRAFECERLDGLEDVTARARVLGPDVIVLDGDLEGATNVVEALLDDPLTDSTPIIVLGHFTGAERGARFIALGVNKTLTKPVSPELLRSACRDAVDQRAGHTIRVALGEPTVEQLGERLAEEVRHALIDAVDAAGRGCRVPLGEGAEVFGAIWGAIARVREVVASRTDGAVKFSGRGPEGAIAMAPWLHESTSGERAVLRGRGAAADVRLDGRRVIVADDDPGVTWFIADLLRTSGCTVYEALDGQTALDLAYRHTPDLIVSDILMPKLDGFALSRALRRDVALRDVPVILLSWKEDLLQRVRELGASAAAYLRKESDARAIVARVREALWSRARLEARLRASGEVRGRLDGMTMRTLLEIVCAIRPDASFTIRDASHSYQLEIRAGAPWTATRSAVDGRFESGEKVIAALLGVTAARFVVSNATATVKPALVGTLAQQLAPAIAMARGASAALGGTRTMAVEHVDLDANALHNYLLATPSVERELIERIALGESPRELLLAGDAEPAQLEEVLVQLAARGVVRGVRSIAGEDLLATSIDEMCAAAGIPPIPLEKRIHTSGFVEKSAEAIDDSISISPPPSQEIAVRNAPAVASGPAPVMAKNPSQPPSSLADAVMRELRESSSNPPSIVEPTSLKLRVATPSAPDVTEKSPSARTDVDPKYELHPLADTPVPPSKLIIPLPSIDLDDDSDEIEIPVLQASEPQTPLSAEVETDLPLTVPKKKAGWLPIFGLLILSISAAAVLRWTI